MNLLDPIVLAAFLTGVVGPILIMYFRKKWATNKCDPLKEAIDTNQIVATQLESMMEELECDRIWLSQFHNGGNFYPTGKSIQKFSVFYEFVTPGTPSIKSVFQNIPVSLFNSAFSHLYEHGELLIEDLKGTESKKFGFDQFVSQFKSKSCYIFAVFDLNDRFLGTLGVDYGHSKYKLNQTELSYIRQKAASIGTVIDTYLYKNK